LVTLRQLAKWGLGPNPSDKALAHEITVRRSKFLTLDKHYIFYVLL